jgi:capsular polysaccharide biosynthesis protein
MTASERAHVGGRIRPWPLVRRRWWLLALTTVAVIGAAHAISSIQKESHSAKALVVIPVGASERAPGSANDSRQLAVTYAALIPQDGRILRAVARDLRVSLSEARRGISVTNTAGTALLELGFEHVDPQGAVRGARALARAVNHGASSNIPRTTTSLVRLPSKPVPDSPAGDFAGLLAALLVGLFLGSVLMVFLERADARVDESSDLERALGLPVTALGRRSVGPQVALVERWARIARRERLRVAFVPATRTAERPSAAAAEALAAAARRRGHDVVVERSGQSMRLPQLEPAYAAAGGVPVEQPESGGRTVMIAPAAGPGREPSGESTSLSSDVVVLVSRRGDALREVETRLRALHGLGIEVERALLAPRRFRAARTQSVGRR